uniref:Elongation factor 1-gamma n=1 Tax=Latimeria chalumnae TaxID=7897 RepID=H3BEE7_LATCH
LTTGTTLYTYPNCWRTNAVLIAAKYGGVELKVVSVPQFETSTGGTESFLKKFPLKKLPVFEGEDGFYIYGSNAIAHYVGSDSLRGSSLKDSALIQQWMSYADNEVLPAAATWVYPTLGRTVYNKQTAERAKEVVRQVLTVLDEHLRDRTFLVGECITLADITMACALLWPYKQVLEPSFREPYIHVNQWFITCMTQPAFVEVLGDVKLCEKASEYRGKEFYPIWPYNEEPKEVDPTTREQKEVAEIVEGKMGTISKKQKKVVEEMDATELALKEEPKAKDPFAFLPKSSFVLDEFKRKYSNEDTLTVALPYLWEHFDKEGWSIWYGEHKYPGELNQIFMSCNLITGMFQRLDSLRKNAFASVILFGGDGDSCISGVWILRGQQLAFEMCDDWKMDYESYSWRKLDPDSEECKTTVKEYFTWEGAFMHAGKPFNQGKIFK